LFNVSSNNIIDQYPEYDIKVVNVVALCEWRQQKKTSFKDLSDALTKVDYNQFYVR
jgi:hypothetical protein